MDTLGRMITLWSSIKRDNVLVIPSHAWLRRNKKSFSKLRGLKSRPAQPKVIEEI